MNYQHRIQYYETDKMGITHHSNYIRFMEEARISFLESIGWGYDKMEQEGIISPVVDIECYYHKTTTYPDVIDIHIDVLKNKNIKLKLGYTMKVNHEVVCTGSSTHCFLNKEGKPISYSKRFPELYQLLDKYQKKEL